MVRVRQLLGRKGHDVWSVDADEPVLDAIQIMADQHVGALPVTRDGELVGVISERDYARKVILLGPLVGRDAGLADHELAGGDGDAGRRRAPVHAGHDRAAHPPPARDGGRAHGRQ